MLSTRYSSVIGKWWPIDLKYRNNDLFQSAFTCCKNNSDFTLNIEILHFQSWLCDMCPTKTPSQCNQTCNEPNRVLQSVNWSNPRGQVGNPALSINGTMSVCPLILTAVSRRCIETYLLNCDEYATSSFCIYIDLSPEERCRELFVFVPLCRLHYDVYYTRCPGLKYIMHLIRVVEVEMSWLMNPRRESAFICISIIPVDWLYWLNWGKKIKV